MIVVVFFYLTVFWGMCVYHAVGHVVFGKHPQCQRFYVVAGFHTYTVPQMSLRSDVTFLLHI